MHHRNGSEVSGTGSSATASYTPSYFNSSRYSSVLTKTERPPNLGSSRWYTNFNNSISNSTLPNASSSNSSRSTYPTTSAISTTSPFSSTVSTNRTVLNSFRNRYS
ncbi:hypothetical protein GJ496_006527 [Pomphorhynchus laevis]|nr:hypothetical protein GJ496_006527 [Pomphorhynchus laevis]